MRESGVIAGAPDFRSAQPAAGAARRDAKNTAVAVFPEIEHFATFKPVERSLLRFRKGAKAHVQTAMWLPGLGRKRGASAIDARGVESRVAADDDLTVRFIVITADEDFYQRLQQIAGAYDWRIGRALSTDEARALISAQPTPIVIYDSDSNGGNWRGAFKSMSDLPAHPCVLLASRVADDYLLQEVVRNHGYDLLPKSAPSEKLSHCLKFAWSWARARVHREDAGRSG